jgi:DNA polymerase-1
MTSSPQLTFVEPVDPDSRGAFEQWLQRTQDDYLSVDTETTGLNVWHDRIRSVQFGDRQNGFFIPYEESDAAKHLAAWALWYCAKKGRPLAAHRMKFDSSFLSNAGHNVEAICEDGKARAHLVDSTCSGLKPYAGRHFGEWAVEGEKKLAAIYRKTKTNWATIPLRTFEYWWYAAMDPVLESRVMEDTEEEVIRDYFDLYEMELDVSLALQRAEKRGILVDLEYCQEQYDILAVQIDALKSEWDWLNLGSGDQVADALEAGWGIELPLGPPGPKTGRRKRKADEDTLAQYAGNELVDDVLRYRGLKKNATTYFGAYLEQAVDGRIHTFVETLGARTGRMSDRDPNLQNVPKREAGDYVRQAFMATPGRILILADYRQIEYRIFASAAGEPDMIQAILDGEDLHAVTARMTYDDPSITSEDPRRDIAKNGNFAEIYFAGIAKFASTAGITEAAARKFKKAYHSKFTRVKPFSQAVLHYAQENGMAVDTRFGRRIPVDAGKVYAALNYMIQGSAADVLKRAIQKIAGTEWDEYFVLPVHDELIFDVPEELAPRLMKELPELMEDRETFKVPLEIDLTRAYRWGQKEAA